MEAAFDILREHGLIRKGQPDQTAFNLLRTSQILDIASSLTMSNDDDLPESSRVLIHAASADVGGGVQSCSALPCRLQRLDSLARFAALYSDRVYVRNYFSGYDALSDWPLTDLRWRLLEDVTMLMSVRPLLDRGFISLVAPASCMCPKCLGIIDENLKQELAAMQSLAVQLLERDCEIQVGYFKGSFEIEVFGPIGLSHSLVLPLDRFDFPISRALLKEIRRGKKFTVPEPLQKEVLEDLASTLVSDLGYQAATALEYGASFITASEVHTNLQRVLSGTEDPELVDEREATLGQVLLDIPFLVQVPLATLVELRERHTESFARFRSALRRVAAEVRSTGQQRPEILRELRADIIDPELARVDAAVKTERNRLVGRAVPAIINMGVLGIGIATGMLINQPLAGFATGLLASQATEALRNAVEARRATAQPDQSDFYFLWKVRQVAVKH